MYANVAHIYGAGSRLGKFQYGLTKYKHTMASGTLASMATFDKTGCSHTWSTAHTYNDSLKLGLELTR